MSQIITLYVQEAIVMAADSRITRHGEAPFYSDTSQKIYLTDGGVGISTCGDAIIDSKRIQFHIEDFIKENKYSNAEDIADTITPWFKNRRSDLDTTFHVAGFIDGEKRVFRVNTKEWTVSRCDNEYGGLIWNGDNYVLNRLIKDFFFRRDNGSVGEQCAYRAIPWGSFLAQDAIAFTRFAMETAIRMQDFHQMEHTIGGPIDILVITKDGEEWAAHK